MAKTELHTDNKEKIIVKGARTHNLKNITVEMPRNKMVVFTGLSGSGKSSLAFDTIFAEGQRRYVESLSSYARQFLRQMQKPDVDEIIGLSPAISIDQKSRSNNPRSNVATITEIYDYMRILFARIGRPHCLVCGREIKRLSQEEILATILETVHSIDVAAKKKEVMGVAYDDLKIKLYSPVVVGRKGEYYQLLYDLLGKGYTQVKVDGHNKKLREQIILDKNKKHDIDVLVDEIYLSEFKDEKSGAKERLSEAVEKALEESKGLLKIESPEGERLISSKFMCPYDGFSYPEIEPRLFSFNSPYGACPTCNGLGTKYFFGDEVCPTCNGTRLREEALHVFLGDDAVLKKINKTLVHKKAAESASDYRNPAGVNIAELISFSIKDTFDFFQELKLTRQRKKVFQKWLSARSTLGLFL
jgi:excinuclease ABC subunit A